MRDRLRQHDQYSGSESPTDAVRAERNRRRSLSTHRRCSSCCKPIAPIQSLTGYWSATCGCMLRACWISKSPRHCAVTRTDRCWSASGSREALLRPATPPIVPW